MYVIGIGHETGHGKDTVASLMRHHFATKNYGYSVTVSGFAVPLKRHCYELFKWAGIQTKEYYDENRAARRVVLPKVGKTPLQLWIEVGELMRTVHPNIWIEKLISDNSGTDILIVPDMRHENEYNFVDFRMKVFNPRVESFKEGIDQNLSHKTDWHYILTNDSTIRALNEPVEELVKRLHMGIVSSGRLQGGRVI